MFAWLPREYSLSRGSVQHAKCLDSHDVAEFKGARLDYPGKTLMSGVMGGNGGKTL